MSSTPANTHVAWFNDLALKDRFGDRVHYAIALILLAVLPCNSAVAGGFFGALVIWYLVRLYYWKPYMLSGPMQVLVPGILWILYIALSLAWTSDTTVGFRGVWANRWILIVAGLWPLMARWPYLALAIMIGALIQSVAMIIDGYMEWKHYTGKAVMGLGDHPRTSAAWIAASAVGVSSLYLSGHLKRWYWLLALIPFLFAIVLSGSRGAFLAFVIGTTVAVVCLLATKRACGIRLLSLTLCAIVILAGTIVFQSRILPTSKRAIQATAQYISNGEIHDIRFVWWKSCVRQWKKHPLLGYGAGGFAEAAGSDELIAEDTHHLTQKWKTNVLKSNQPHSTYFQILVEGGIVGVALFAFLLGSIAFIALRTAKNHPIGSMALGGLMVWMVTAAFDSWHTQGQTLALLWVVATFASTHPHCYEQTPAATEDA